MIHLLHLLNLGFEIHIVPVKNDAKKVELRMVQASTRTQYTGIVRIEDIPQALETGESDIDIANKDNEKKKANLKAV